MGPPDPTRLVYVNPNMITIIETVDRLDINYEDGYHTRVQIGSRDYRYAFETVEEIMKSIEEQ